MNQKKQAWASSLMLMLFLFFVGIGNVFAQASAGTSTFTLSATTAVASQTVTLTVTVRDANGNVLPNQNVFFETPTSGATLGISTVTTNASGVGTATFTMQTTVGDAVVRAYLGTNNAGALIGTQTVRFNASPTQSTMTSTLSTLTAGGSDATVTIELKNAAGAAITSVTVPNYVAFTTNAGTLTSTVNSGTGTATVSLTPPTSTQTPTAIVTATFEGGTQTQSLAINAGTASATASTIAASSTSVNSDVGTATITVQVKDTFGNNLTVGGNTVTLTSSSASATLSAVTDNGNGTYTAILSSSDITATNITGTVSGTNMISNVTVTFTASTGTSTVSVGSATSTVDNSVTVTVQLKGASGTNATASGGTVTMTTTLGNLTAVTDNGDGTYTATLTSTGPNSTGTATITAALNGSLLTQTATVTFSPGTVSAASSTLTASSSSVSTDIGSTILTVLVTDSFGNTITTGETVTVTITSGTASGTATLGATTLTTNASGQASTTLTATGTGTVGVTVDIGTGTKTLDVTFTPGTASATNSAFTSNSVSATTDNEARFTLELKDANGNDLTASGGSVVFSVVTHTMTVTPTLSPVSNNNNGSYTVDVSSTKVGTATLTATVNGVATTKEAAAVFTPGAGSALSTITASPTTVSTDGGNSVITVQLKDAGGNNLTASGGTVTLSATNSATLSAVTNNNNGTYTATLTSTTPGLVTITGTVSGTTITGNATVTFTVGNPSVANSTITASPSSVVIGGNTSIVTVQLKDTNGNNVTSGGDIVTLSTTAGTLSTVTDNGNGTYTATLTSPASTGTATITGSLNGNAITATATVTFTAAAPSTTTSTITASSTSLTVGGTSTITLQLKDANGNNLSSGGHNVTLSSDGGTLSSVTDNNNGTYTATLTSTTPGTVTVTGTLDDDAFSSIATVTFSVGTATGSTSVISASQPSLASGGTTTVTVQLKDVYGNNLTTGGHTIVLSSTLGTLSAVTNNANGTYTATLTSNTSGIAVITGTVSGTAIAGTTSVTFTASLSQSMISASPTSVSTDNGNSTITVQLKDAAGNNLTASGGTVVLATNLGTMGAVTDNGDGTYTAILTSTVTGTATVTGTLTNASASGAALTSSATVTFTLGAVSAVGTTITAAADYVGTASGTTTITVQLKDANGNNHTSGSGNIVLSTSFGSLSALTNNGDGTYTALLTSVSTGTAVVSGTLNGIAINSTATVVFFNSNIGRSTFALSATSVPANGTSTSIMTATVRDGNNNPVSGQSVFFTLSGQGSLSAGPWTTDASGVATAIYTSSLTPDAAELKAYVGTAADEDYLVGTASITTTAGAYVQFVHNSPAGVVDVKINNTTLVDDFAYQTASTFLPVAADVAMDVSVTTSNGSTTLLTINGATFANNKHYILIAQGGADGKAFEMKVVDYARSTSTLSEAMQFFFSHGVTNGPAVNVERVTTTTPRTLEQLIAVNAAYGSAGNYLTQLNPGITTLQLKAAGSVVGQYLFDFGAYAGKSMTLLATGRVGGTGANQLMIIGVDADGKVVTPQVTTSNEVEAELPAVFTVHGNYPNPFNPTTNVRFDLPEQANVRIEVVDVIGRKVMTVAPQTMSAGANKVITIDAARLSSGTYFYRVVAEGATRTFVQGSKFTLVK
jgi:adhesin/invasin